MMRSSIRLRHGPRPYAASALVCVLLTTLLLAARGRVVVFEAGSGEHEQSVEAQSRSYVLIDQSDDGDAVSETLMTIETWQAPAGSLLVDGGIAAAFRGLLHPLSWLYQQLEAIDAIQRASVNTFLMRYYEAVQADQAWDEEEARQDDAGANAPEQLQRLGCKRFAAAMDEYMQAVEAAAFEDALDLQAIVELVEASDDAQLQAELDHLTQLEEEEQEAQQEMLNMLEQDLHTLQAIAGSSSSLPYHGSHPGRPSHGLVDDGATLIVVSVDEMDPEDWDDVSEILAEALEADGQDPFETQAQVHTNHHHHQQSHQPLPHLRGQGDSSADARHRHGADTWHAGARGNGLHPQPHHQETHSNDVYQPFVDLLAESEEYLQQQRGAAAAMHGSAGHATALASDSSTSKVWWSSTVAIVEQDWPLMVLLAIGMAVMGAAFVVSWMQTAVRQHRHLRVPVMVSHNGRLVQAVVLVPEGGMEGGIHMDDNPQLVVSSKCA